MFLPLASVLIELPARLGEIFYFIVMPVLILAGVGYFLQRRLGLDMPTLSRLNFYLVVPGVVYVSLVEAEVSGGDVATVVIFATCMLFGQMAISYLAARIRRLPHDRRNVLMMNAMFHNSGNYGLPLQELAFGLPGRTLQIFYMVVQNVGNFTLGVLLAAGGRKDRHWRQNLLQVAKFPPLYVLPAALITILVRNALADSAPQVARAMVPFWSAVSYVGRAMIAVALVTLGAQLATVKREAHNYPIKLSVVLRLLVGPALGLGLILAMGLHGFVAQVMLVSTSTPTAVNCMLLCLEFDNHPDFAARAVFYSTIFSPITVTLVIFLAQSGLI